MDHASIHEVLSTGLFTSRGLKRLGWSHQTYAEFLAAVYLDKQSVPLDRMMDLLTHPDHPESKIVPQLHESAAWAANLRSELFQHIVTTEPEILLRSDVAAADQAERSASLLLYWSGLIRDYPGMNANKAVTTESYVTHLFPHSCSHISSTRAKE